MRHDKRLIACAAVIAAAVAHGAEKWLETPPPTGKSVTWARLNKLDPGLKQIGRLAVCEAKDLKSSAWSIGCETLDRDYADWDAIFVR